MKTIIFDKNTPIGTYNVHKLKLIGQEIAVGIYKRKGKIYGKHELIRACIVNGELVIAIFGDKFYKLVDVLYYYNGSIDFTVDTDTKITGDVNSFVPTYTYNHTETMDCLNNAVYARLAYYFNNPIEPEIRSNDFYKDMEIMGDYYKYNYSDFHSKVLEIVRSNKIETFLK